MTVVISDRGYLGFVIILLEILPVELWGLQAKHNGCMHIPILAKTLQIKMKKDLI